MTDLSHLPGTESVLSVWAHPDDETYLAAAHMMRAARGGRQVRCLTATRGELGSPDPERWPPGDPLAAVRTVEMVAALGELGITDHHWLGYPDGGCSDVPLAEGAAIVLEHLRDIRPDTVLTFGPDGMTGHSDHQSVSRWVDAAVDIYDGPKPQVLWATNTPEWFAQWGPTLEAAGAYMGSVPPVTPRDELKSYLVLTDDEREAKVRALLAQESQIGPMVELFGLERFRSAFTEESFR